MSARADRHKGRWPGLRRASRMLGMAALAIIVPAVTMALAAPNDFEVQASNVTALKAGAVFEKGARLVLPAGGVVTLIDRTGGTARTRECGGVYDGPVERCSAPAAGTGKSVGGGTRGGVR